MATATRSDRRKIVRQSKRTRIAAILAAAREEFERRGYEKAKVADIAARVGVVEGTVFHYFANKRALMFGVMEHFYRRITEDQRKGIKGIRGTRNRLRYVIWHHLDIMSRNAALCGVILRESRGLDGTLSKDIQGFNRRYTECLKTVVEEGIAGGDIRPGTPAALVRDTVYGSIEHALWSLLSEGHDIDVEKSADALTDLVFHGISTDTEALDKREVASLIRKLERLI